MTFDFDKIVDTAARQAVESVREKREPVKSFDFQYEEHHKEAVNAVRECNDFCTDMIAGINPRWMSLIGRSGCGKTHLAKSLKEIYKQAYPRKIAQFWQWKKIVDDYLLQWDFGIINWLSEEVDFLVIDDIGAEQKTKIGLPNLYKILDARLGKWTVLTSNLLLPQIFEMEGRIASRMVRGGSQVVSFRDCPDWSLEQFKKRQNY